MRPPLTGSLPMLARVAHGRRGGVDVADATVMVDQWTPTRFGCQLHQLRGRVGRGRRAGGCACWAPRRPEESRAQAALAERCRGLLGRLPARPRSTWEHRQEGDVLGATRRGGRRRLKLLQRAGRPGNWYRGGPRMRPPASWTRPGPGGYPGAGRRDERPPGENRPASPGEAVKLQQASLFPEAVSPTKPTPVPTRHSGPAPFIPPRLAVPPPCPLRPVERPILHPGPFVLGDVAPNAHILSVVPLAAKRPQKSEGPACRGRATGTRWTRIIAGAPPGRRPPGRARGVTRTRRTSRPPGRAPRGRVPRRSPTVHGRSPGPACLRPYAGVPGAMGPEALSRGARRGWVLVES